MRRIGTYIGKMCLPGITLLFDPAKCRFKEHISAKTFGLDDRVIMTNDRIEITGIFIGIGREICLTAREVLADSTGTMESGLR